MANKYIYIGAAWKKKGKDGKTFLSFSVEQAKVAECPNKEGKIQATLYENSKKTKDSQPDFNLVVKAEEGSSGPDDLPF